ncbi:MAG: hypothetical protein K0S61_4526, partial [Anaerocolumna sp.]|nr:hypothetical protein [Anaerocolumna sp.]
TTRYEGDANYLMKKVINAKGEATAYDYDANYNVTKIVEPDNSEVSSLYDSKGNLLEVTDEENLKTSYIYTDLNRVKEVTDTSGKKTDYFYDGKGNLKTMTSPDHELITYSYDNYGNLTEVLFPNGHTEKSGVFYGEDEITFTYEDTAHNLYTAKTLYDENLKNLTNGNQATSFFNYDKRDNLIEVIPPNISKQAIVKYNIDGNYNLEEIEYQEGQTLQAAAKLSNDLGNKRIYNYNSLNQIEQAMNEDNQIVNYSYDGLGRLHSITYGMPEENSTFTASFVNKQELAEITAPITNEYDELNRIKKVTLNQKDEKIVWDITYDSVGNVIEVRKNDTVTQIYDYYKDGLVKQTKDRNYQLDYEYYAGVLLNKIEVHKGGTLQSTITNEPSNLNRVKSTSIDGTKAAEYFFDSLGRVEQIALGNQSNTQMLLEPNTNRLQTQINTLPDGTILHQFNFNEYDGNNNILALERIKSGVSHLFNYEYEEGSNFLTKENLEDGNEIAYAYDLKGNRTSKTTIKGGQSQTTAYFYRDDNTLSSVEQNGEIKSYQYDVQGNMILDEKNTYVYDALDQLIAINETRTAIPVANYIYNSNGERIQKTVNGKQTNYFYQGDFLLYETDSDNNITREYIWSESGYPIAFKYQGNMYYYHTNYRGDVLAITDQSGTIVAEYSYDAWGNILSQSGDLANINPLRYAGCYYDAETKFYYLMNRYYNPEHGVFISLDPDAGDLLDPITQNGYIYADNNPIVLKDMTGTAVDIILDIASIGVSSYELLKNPSWKNAGTVALDLGAAALPFVPSATSVKVAAKLVTKNKYAKVATRSINKLSKSDILIKSASNSNLKNAIREMYRVGASVGDGSLAAAIRVEAKYGTLVGGKSHLIKGRERIRQLEKLMGSGKLNQSDWKIANNLAIELKRALNGK